MAEAYGDGDALGVMVGVKLIEGVNDCDPGLGVTVAVDVRLAADGLTEIDAVMDLLAVALANQGGIGGLYSNDRRRSVPAMGSPVKSTYAQPTAGIQQKPIV